MNEQHHVHQWKELKWKRGKGNPAVAYSGRWRWRRFIFEVIVGLVAAERTYSETGLLLNTSEDGECRCFYLDGANERVITYKLVYNFYEFDTEWSPPLVGHRRILCAENVDHEAIQ